MRKYLYGFFLGAILGGILIFGVSAMADGEDMKFNMVRISNEGNDIAQWGENYTLANGEKVPYSIVYKDTTYLPLRKLAELNNIEVMWNGDTQTVYLGAEKYVNSSFAQKPDKNGNIWTYTKLKLMNDRDGLFIEDKERGYARVYEIVSNSVEQTEDAVFFDKVMPSGETKRWKIEFLNDENTQDGEEVK